ncbi:MAG: NAD(P)-dependent glycerol-3-phosphate dehydrogenase, partial [Chloroflexi bacterium]|nr:NAD(P)-dependent glycerol-3-phosphate dehydrogenase [Chloroflexota bacterium]
LARNGQPVTLLARTAEEAAELGALRSNERRLPGVVFPDLMRVDHLPSAIDGAGLVCIVVPSRSIEENVRRIAPSVPGDATVLSAVKGIERETGRRMSEIIRAELPDRPVAVLSGPNLSREVAAGLPGSTVIATADADEAALRDAFHSASLRVYTSRDVVGVELGGALKNVVSIAAGMVDSLGFGDNAKAALLTRGLAEISRLGVAAGADPLTFQGLAGMGDLVASSYSPFARNRRLGELVAGGATLEDALSRLGETAEGATTILSVRVLSERYGVEMPITEALYRVLYEGQRPLQALDELMSREPGFERASTPR